MNLMMMIGCGSNGNDIDCIRHISISDVINIIIVIACSFTVLCVKSPAFCFPKTLTGVMLESGPIL